MESPAVWQVLLEKFPEMWYPFPNNSRKAGIGMLVIQRIDLTWYKQERGGRCAQVRRQFPMAYPLQDIPPQCAAAVHRIGFYQQGERFLDAAQMLRQGLERSLPRLGFSPGQVQNTLADRLRLMERSQLQTFSGVEELSLTNLLFRPAPEGIAVSFFYDGHRCGAPFRRGHNQDFRDPASPLCGKDCLNETAFVLSPGQYGRILWNERKTGDDDRTWYYQLHIYNLLYHTADQPPERDILILKEPDLCYQQMAVLY